MKISWNKKGWIGGVIVLLFCSAIIPGISSKTNTITIENIINDKSSDNADFATLTFYTLDETDKTESSVVLSVDDAKNIFNIFEDLKNKSIYYPKSEETEILKNDFITLLDENSLIPQDLSVQSIQSLINPQWDPDNPIIKSKIPFLGLIFEMLSRNWFNLFRFSEILPAYSDWNIFCNIGSAGVGVPVPIIMIPRPRAFAMWLASYAETAIGSLVIPKSFIAEGSQQGLAIGFTGVGLTIAFGGITAYGMLGYAMYTSVQAESFYRTNIAPTVSNENPSSGANNVPISLDDLSFRISDGDGDLMDYTVTTSPNIGSKSEYSKGNGVIHVPVSGLASNTDYTWHVTVNDGYDTVNKHFTFKTEAVAPELTDPSPSDGSKEIPISLSQLSFKLKDYQGDLMDYTVETTPDIGSSIGNNVGDGTYTMNVGSLEYFRWYTWYVNVTDGTHWTRKVFDFQTEVNMVFDPFDEGWMYRKMITIDHTKVDGNLVDFPVLISIVDNDLKNKAQFDGDDILFMENTGVATRLFHEIESFDGSSGELVAWVEIPSLSSSVDTVLYVYYGNPPCSSQQYPDNVWDGDYVAVYHMNGNDYTDIDDSTSHNLDVIGYQGNPLYQQVGKIGLCVDFDDDSLDVADNDILSFTDGSDNDKPMTLEAWIKCDIPGGEVNPILSKYEHNNIEWLLYKHSSYDRGQLYIIRDSSGGGINRFTESPLNLDNSGWNYLSAIYNGNETGHGISFILDGIFEEGEQFTGNYLGMQNTNAQMRIGAYYTDSGGGAWYYWQGLIDEVRISNIARTTEWLKTSFNTMNDPSSFFSVGPEET